MADKFSVKKRSEIMSKISGKDTKPELIVRKRLFAEGFRYRLNVKTHPGKPDIVLRKYKTVIFIHGCFWHGHEGCKKASLPTTNKKFWSEKISKNVSRDQQNQIRLQNMDWNVIVIWQCELKNKDLISKTMASVIQKIKSGASL